MDDCFPLSPFCFKCSRGKVQLKVFQRRGFACLLGQQVIYWAWPSTDLIVIDLYQKVNIIEQHVRLHSPRSMTFEICFFLRSRSFCSRSRSSHWSICLLLLNASRSVRSRTMRSASVSCCLGLSNCRVKGSLISFGLNCGGPDE